MCAHEEWYWYPVSGGTELVCRTVVVEGAPLVAGNLRRRGGRVRRAAAWSRYSPLTWGSRSESLNRRAMQWTTPRNLEKSRRTNSQLQHLYFECVLTRHRQDTLALQVNPRTHIRTIALHITGGNRTMVRDSKCGIEYVYHVLM